MVINGGLKKRNYYLSIPLINNFAQRLLYCYALLSKKYGREHEGIYMGYLVVICYFFIVIQTLAMDIEMTALDMLHAFDSAYYIIPTREEMDAFDIGSYSPVTEELRQRADNGDINALIALETDCCRNKKYEEARAYYFRILLRMKQDVACTNDWYVRSYFRSLKWALDCDFPDANNQLPRPCRDHLKEAINWLVKVTQDNVLPSIQWLQELAKDNQKIFIVSEEQAFLIRRFIAHNTHKRAVDALNNMQNKVLGQP